MEHGKKARKFGRKTKQRSALMRSLALALITNGRIITTEAKAKSLKIFIDKLVNKSKINNQSVMKQLTAEIGTIAAGKLLKEISPRFAEIMGGYSRVRKISKRTGDGSSMSVIEFTK